LSIVVLFYSEVSVNLVDKVNKTKLFMKDWILYLLPEVSGVLVVDKLIGVEVAAVEVEVTDIDSSAVVFNVKLVRSAVVVEIADKNI
jgi:hypothetical protein